MKVSYWGLIFCIFAIPFAWWVTLQFSRASKDTQIILMIPIGTLLAFLYALSFIAVFGWTGIIFGFVQWM